MPHLGDFDSAQPAPHLLPPAAQSAKPPTRLPHNPVLENADLTNDSDPAYLHAFALSLLPHLPDTPQGSNADPKDLEDAIAALRRATAVTPDGHADKPAYLTALAPALSMRFD